MRNATPCMLNPDGWDLDVGRTTTAAERAEQATAAVALCEPCPFRLACLDEVRGHPPTHACVWGGLVFDQRFGRAGLDLDQWIRLDATTSLRPHVGDKVSCPACGAEVVADAAGRKYCDDRCRLWAENERHRIRRREGAPRDAPKRAWVQAEQRREQVTALRASGLTTSQIAGRLQVTSRSVRRYELAAL